MKLIYIAGPYRGDTEKNVAAAVEAGNILKHDGRAFPVVPHLIGGGYCGPLGEDYMLAGTLHLMRRCDAVLALPTWQKSEGATKEVRVADREEVPVFYSHEELFRWLSGERVGTFNGQRGTLEELLAGLPQTLRLRCSDRALEIREWRTEADDGLIYEAHTVGRVRLSSRGEVLFEQIENEAPVADLECAQTGKITVRTAKPVIDGPHPHMITGPCDALTGKS